MKTEFTSLEELMGSCHNSSNKRLVSSVLRNSKYMEWSFVSGSVDDDECRAEFVSKMENSDLEQHLSCVENEFGVCWNISTIAPALTVA